MRSLSFLVLLVLLVTLKINSQSSPHGDKFNIKCDVCHISNNWIILKNDSFNHNNTHFPLVGRHRTVNCKKCHVDLIFDHAKSDCYSCHLDIHQPTVGQDCERCHNSISWIIKSSTHVGQFDINGKTDCSRCHGTDSWKTVNFDHNSSRFKLDGSHRFAKCNECHKEVIDEKGKYIQYKFKNIECSSCHS